jgi:hypothetical protein
MNRSESKVRVENRDVQIRWEMTKIRMKFLLILGTKVSNPGQTASDVFHTRQIITLINEIELLLSNNSFRRSLYVCFMTMLLGICPTVMYLASFVPMSMDFNSSVSMSMVLNSSVSVRMPLSTVVLMAVFRISVQDNQIYESA